ncbi:MAG: hypothetical protein J6M17_09490 [Ruminococcus sp.]|nr:hypothetical protein [Ruminococcus sp.]
MENYLGIKTKMGNKIDYILIGFFGLLIVASISVIIDKGADLVMLLIIIAINAAVIYFAVRRILNRALAKRLAKYFYASPESELTVDSIQTKLNIKDLNRRLPKLIDNKFMKNLAYNEGDNIVTILAEHRMVQQKQFYEVNCPNCGAQNRIQEGRICKCRYCDTEMIAGQNVKV